MTFQRLVLLLLLGSIAGCGFHLRGVGQINEVYQPLYLEKARLTDVQYEAILSRLQRSNVELADSAEGSNRMLVRFIKNKDSSVNRSESNVRLIELVMDLEFSIIGPQGVLLKGPQKITQRKLVELDDNNVLSQAEQVEKARQDQQRALVQQMFFRLR